MLIDDEQKQLHWRLSARIVLASLAILICFAVLPPVFAASVQASSFMRFQLGYFLIAHGAIAGIIATVYWFISSQEAADRTFNITTHS